MRLEMGDWWELQKFATKKCAGEGGDSSAGKNTGVYIIVIRPLETTYLSQAKDYLRQRFQALTQSEQIAILDPKGSSRGVPKNASSKQADLIQDNKSDNGNASTPMKPTKSPDGEHQQDKASQSGPGRSKKPKDPEKSAKVRH